MHTIFSGKLAAVKFTVIHIDVETLIFERDPRNSQLNIDPPIQAVGSAW